MTEQELRAQVAHLQIVVKRLMNTSLSGDFSSAFRGGGLEFSQLRQYQRGDEVRSIDWKSSAKMHKLMVKEFIQEKERTVIIALDISSSLNCSSQYDLKQSYAHNMAASLAMIAQNTNDKVGLLLFADGVQRYVPPRKGRGHGAYIVRQIFSTPVAARVQTDFTVAFNHLASMRERGAIVFVVSDWIADEEGYTSLLPVVGRQYETVAVRVVDPRERHMPDVGVLPVIDPETGQTVLLDTRGAAGRALNEQLGKRLHDQKRLLKKNSIDVLDIDVGNSFVDALASFFYGRAR